MQRPKKLQSSSYLGVVGAQEHSPSEPIIVQDIFSQKVWGEDNLGWEAFLDAIGVREFARLTALEPQLEDLTQRLGASLCRQDWWTNVLKRGLRVQAYVLRRCQQAKDVDLQWLRTLPVSVEVDAPKARSKSCGLAKLDGSFVSGHRADNL